MKPIFRTIEICVTVTACTFAGCDWNRRQTVIEPTRPPAAAAAAETPREDAPRIMARVNHQAIPMAALYDALVRDEGVRVAQQLIADEVVRQELQARNLPTHVTDLELQAETRRALSQVFQFDNAPSPRQWEDLLRQLLAQRNLTRRMWDATMTRNVLLGRLAELDPRAAVEEEDLREAFYEEYDARLKVQHVQVPTMVLAQEVREKALRGADFSQLAFHYSTNPSGKTGGWLPDFGPRTAPDTIPPPIVRAGRALKNPGDISHIVQVGSNFHVLRLQEIVPPRQARYSEVKGKLRHLVRERKIQRLQPIILKELIDKAQIEYVDPVLRSKVKRGKAS